jgi:hypothetical protein
MENMKGRTKKPHREEPDGEIEVKGRKDPGDPELMKYYVYKEAALSPSILKRYERLFSFEKQGGEGRR